MFGTQSLWISEIAGMEENGQSALFIELLRSAICQRRKNNVMTVSNGQLPVVKLLLEMTAKPAISGHIGFSNCHSLERTFQFDTEILHRKSGRLFSRFLNACLTPLNVTIQG